MLEWNEYLDHNIWNSIFEIKIIFYEIKKNLKIIFYCNWIICYCRTTFEIGVWENKYFDYFEKYKWAKQLQIAFPNVLMTNGPLELPF